jgi:hypothetical protein
LTRRLEISHRFVEFIPRELDEGVLYISERFKTASHLCCCGCGQKVVTPLNPSKWLLQDYGSTVSLSPSVGLGAFPCRSHYWIRRSQVQWCRDMSEAETAYAQRADRLADQIYTGERRISEPSFTDFIDRCARAVAIFARWLLKR